MAGWAVAGRGCVLVADPRLAAELVKGLDALDRERRYDAWANPPELVEFRDVLAALATSDALPIRVPSSEVVAPSVLAERVPVAVAAQLLGKSPRWITYLCDAKRLPAVRDGRRWMIEREAVEALAGRSAA